MRRARACRRGVRGGLGRERIGERIAPRGRDAHRHCARCRVFLSLPGQPGTAHEPGRNAALFLAARGNRLARGRRAVHPRRLPRAACGAAGGQRADAHRDRGVPRPRRTPARRMRRHDVPVRGAGRRRRNAPRHVRVAPRRRAHAAQARGDRLAGRDVARGNAAGHTFHYSAFKTTMVPIARGDARRHGSTGEAVYRRGRLTASYVHLYFPSNPDAAASLFLP